MFLRRVVPKLAVNQKTESFLFFFFKLKSMDPTKPRDSDSVGLRQGQESTYILSVAQKIRIRSQVCQ